MILTCPDLVPPVTELYQLASTAFEPARFRQVCESLWPFDNEESSEDLWYFDIPASEYKPLRLGDASNEEPTFFVEGGQANLIVSVDLEVIGRKPNGSPIYREVGIIAATMSICWWETFAPSDHDRKESWRAERRAFDGCYEQSLQFTISKIGLPSVQGQDDNEDRHRYAIWRGNTGLLILQQSCYDPQFGLDINFWIEPSAGCDPEPTSPFIDWLMNHKKDL